jgi:hypothetical protein
MADQLGRLLDPYPTTLLFFCFLLLDAPAPAPLPSTHHRQRVYVLVWCNSPSVASTGPIFKRHEIVNFKMSMSGHDQHPHKLIKTCGNDTKSNMKQLLDLINMRVRLGGMDFLSPAPSLTISAIRSMSLFFCFSPHQPLHFEGVPSLPPAALPPPLSNSSPSLLSLLPSLKLPFHYPLSPHVLVVAALPVPGCIVDVVAKRGAVLPPPREHATWAWAMGEEGGNVQPHVQL